MEYPDSNLTPSPSNLLQVPTQPTDEGSRRFVHLLISLSPTPAEYENPCLQSDALSVIPVDELRCQALRAQAAGGGGTEWGKQDWVIRALLKWFKGSFFKWVLCLHCSSKTVVLENVEPTPVESESGAAGVEIYQCPECAIVGRFLRFPNAGKLLETKIGRCGEWAKCFALLCRAMGSRVRWVWNSEDRVWTEVYSEHTGQWIHVDPCEETWNRPTLYTEDPSKKMAYCIAFSNEGATDVTRRYVRNPSDALPRNKCTEQELLWGINEIRRLRRKDMSSEEILKLSREDECEERELRGYVDLQGTK